MKFTAAFTAFCIAAVQATVIPSKRANGPMTGNDHLPYTNDWHILTSINLDIEVLNFALTLEHLESAFYTEGLKKYNQHDFIKAGLPDWARGRFEQIAKHEATHVKFLEAALGDQAVKPCEYNLYIHLSCINDSVCLPIIFLYSGDTDIKAFVGFSAMVETVGTSAYTGAAQLITNKVGSFAHLYLPSLTLMSHRTI